MTSDAFSGDQALWTASASLSLAGGPPRIFEIATTLQITGTFASALTGAPTDPTTVILLLENPQGVVETMAHPGQVVRMALGVFTYTFAPTISGRWRFKWQASGSVIATSRDGQFTIVSTGAVIFR